MFEKRISVSLEIFAVTQNTAARHRAIQMFQNHLSLYEWGAGDIETVYVNEIKTSYTNREVTLHCASSVLWLRELSKVLTRVTSRMTTHTSRQLASGAE